MTDALNAIRASTDRLTRLVRPLNDAAIAERAYPAEWSIADVLSHLGSGAVIAQRRVDDTLAGSETPDDFNPAVWDQWNAKAPRAKVDDAIVAMDTFANRLVGVAPHQRSGFKVPMGPLELDWDAFVGLRLNEQLLHEWDVAVTIDPTAVLPEDGTAHVIDNLDLIARFTGKSQGVARMITIATTGPERAVAVAINRDTVTFAPGATAEPDLSMPAESLIRLVYGRLDADHTPAAVTGDDGALDQLRAVSQVPEAVSSHRARGCSRGGDRYPARRSRWDSP